MVLLVMTVDTWSIKLSWKRKRIIFSVIFNPLKIPLEFLNSRKVKVVLLQKNRCSNYILLKSRFLVSSRGRNVLFEAQYRFWRSRGSSDLSLYYRTGHVFCLPKQMDFEPEFTVLVGRTCGSSSQLFLRRELMCVWGAENTGHTGPKLNTNLKTMSLCLNAGLLAPRVAP